MLKRIVMFCLVAVLGCFAVTAQAADRWKMYYSNARNAGYYDTQTLKVSQGKQFVKVWTKVVIKKTGRAGLARVVIDYPEQAIMMEGYVKNQNGRPSYQRLARPVKAGFNLTHLAG